MKKRPLESVESPVELTIKTSDGEFRARYTAAGLARLNFPRGLQKSSGNTLGKIPAVVRGWHRLTEQAVKATLAGRPVTDWPPLDWTGATEFQQTVWRELLKIPCGQTKSYGEISQAIGKPKAVRAVGTACGANPVPVLVPCHRVLAANGKLGGFSGGLDRKRRLLTAEGVMPTE
jgi:methylated-DNA-[protein]-cysteine S-methyltransferase